MWRLYYNDFLTKFFEIKKIRLLLQKKFYWLKMLKDIKKYIQSYNICQRVKAFRHRFYDKMTSFLISGRFWKKISMNSIIELLFNRYENDIYNVIFVVIDRYLKMTLYIVAKSTWSTEDLANVLFNKMFLIFFEIKEVIFDRDLFFVNDWWFAFVIAFVSNVNWTSSFNHKSMNKRKGKIRHWNLIFAATVITNKIIEISCFY